MSEKKKPIAHAPSIEIVGGRVHNLKNINVELPRRKLIVVTGVSGSGKSSLVFHLLYAESHRRYMSTLESSFVRNFVSALERPDVDKINGLQAVIGIGQEISSSRTLRSTVGTLTDVYAFLRLLYARAGEAYSFLTDKKMERQSEEQIHQRIMEHYEGQEITFLAPLIRSRKGHYRSLFLQFEKKGFSKVIINGELTKIVPDLQLDRYKTHNIELVVAEDVMVSEGNVQKIKELIHESLGYGKGYFLLQRAGERNAHFSQFLMDPETGVAYAEPSPNTFSFNSPYGACSTCHGTGQVHEINRKQLIPDPKRSIADGGIPLLGHYKYITLFKKIEEFLLFHGYGLITPIKDIEEEVLDALLYGKKPKNPGSKRSPVNIAKYLLQKTKPKISYSDDPVQIQTCPSCEGQRLKKEARHFKIKGKNIADLCNMSIDQLYAWFEALMSQLTQNQRKIADNILEEIKKRLQLLLDMGLHYLTLARPLQSLSGGEIRRIRIASQIGTQETHLVGVLYVLDEPSIGLHSRDNKRLISALKKLRDLGNTVIVIEHDKETMLQADHLVEIGPGAGIHGGEVVAALPQKDFIKEKCATAEFLSGKKNIATPAKRRQGNGKNIVVKGCEGYTLKKVNLTLPLGKFVAVTGVSGGGKSTLIHHTLVPIVKKYLEQVHSPSLPYKSAKGAKHVNKIVEVTQSPIGRTQRSNVATYTHLFELVRDLFAQLPQAKIRGYKPKRFSFNVKGGRCEECRGAGAKLVEMDFLPSIRIPCEVCKGRFYNRETLEVQFRGNSIADILEMTVEQAIVFFEHHPRILEKLKALEAVGLSYIRLGQHATTLSGGEAQRIKLASELAKRATGNTLYILDEPTTGLHFQDVEYLVKVLQKLVDKGNTVVCIEHNLDLVKTADHIIDLGPEAGQEGGYIIAEGTPEEVAAIPASYTGQFLREELGLS